jgi:hypothetical protein
MLGIVLAGLRKRDDVASERRTNWVVMVATGAKRRQRDLKSNAHPTDRFAVELLAFQVCPDWHVGFLGA